MNRILHIWAALAAGVIITSGIYAQTPASLSPTPNLQFFDTSTGVALPLVGGLVYTYAAGTLTPLATYVDSTLTTQNSNPIVLNSGGYNSAGNGNAGIWLGPSCYKIVVQTVNLVPLYTQDQICNQEGLLQAALFGTGGAALIGFEQPNGIPTNVAAVLYTIPNGTQYPNAQSAITNGCAGSSGGTVVLSGTYFAANLLVPSNCTVLIPSDSALKASSNNYVFRESGQTGVIIQNDGVIDGQLSQSSYSSDCIYAAGMTNFVIRGSGSIQNCGNRGVYYDGSVTGNSHVKILNQRFSGSTADAILSVGGLVDQEIAGVIANCFAATFGLTHCIASHSSWDGTNFTLVSGLDWHDMYVTCPLFNDCGEIGSFSNSTPVPVGSVPTKIRLAHNIWNCLGAGSGFSVSIGSSSSTIDIDGDIADAGGFAGTCRFEFYGGAGGAARGLQYINAPATGTNALIIENGTQNFTVSDGVFNGGIAVTTGDPLFALSNQCGLTFTGNHLILPSSYGTASGAFSILPNQAASNQCDIIISKNTVYGTGTSDGNAMVHIFNGNCTTMSNLIVEGNTARNINWLYDNQNSTCSWDRALVVNNLAAPGVLQLNPTTNLTNLIYNNPGFPSNQTQMGPLPTVVLGGAAGTSATYKICNGFHTAFDGSMTVALTRCPRASSPYQGHIDILTANTPSAAAIIATLTAVAEAFDSGPNCFVNTTFISDSGSQAYVFSGSDSNTATAIQINVGNVALRTGVTYGFDWGCLAN